MRLRDVPIRKLTTVQAFQINVFKDQTIPKKFKDQTIPNKLLRIKLFHINVFIKLAKQTNDKF